MLGLLGPVALLLGLLGLIRSSEVYLIHKLAVIPGQHFLLHAHSVLDNR